MNNLDNRKIKRNFKVKNSADAYSHLSPYGAEKSSLISGPATSKPAQGIPEIQ